MDHLHLLRRSVPEWNAWRQSNPDVIREIDLRYADLRNAALSGANLYRANLYRANLQGARLDGANLQRANLGWSILDGAHLPGASLRRANLGRSSFVRATLPGADLGKTTLDHANLSHAVMPGVVLQEAMLIETRLEGADLRGAHVYGVSAWDLHIDKHTNQHDLIFTAKRQIEVTVDNLEVAQFVFLLLKGPKLRSFIDTVTSKTVLILGSFEDERKTVLDKVRDALRARDYIPLMFDFDQPDSRDLEETISTLAHLSRFVIADLTNPRSIPQELKRIVDTLQSVPIKPIISEGEQEYALFSSIQRKESVLDTYQYRNVEDLLASLHAEVIRPAEDLAAQLLPPGR